MDLRTLGASGLSVTALGLGTRGHRAGLRDTEPGDVDRAIRGAIDGGCRLIDCGAAWGESERVVGAAVRDRRAADATVVTTHVTIAGGLGLAPAPVERAVEASLRATRLEVLPLVWLDGWRDQWLVDPRWAELADTLARLIRAGKALAWGAGVDDPGEAVGVVGAGVIAAVAAPFSLIDRRAAAALVPAAQAAGVAVVARAPLGGDVLAGELGPGVRFRHDDERGRYLPPALLAASVTVAGLARFTRHVPPAAAASEPGRARLDGLRRHPEVVHATVAELAVAYAAGAPGITAALVGARTGAHAAAWWPAGPPAVPPAIRAALDAEPWGAGWPSAHPGP
ncbi:MAG: aldo/keto reductase [Kofleriaceae bacterium]